MKKEYKVTIIILLLAVFLRLIKLDLIMDRMQSDEMGLGYDAWCILHYGTDRYGNSYPLYLVNYGRGASVLYMYLCCLTIKILGYGKFAIRLPALIGSIVLCVSGTALIGECADYFKGISARKAQLIFAILYAVSPYTFMSSRLALDCNLLFGFSTLFLLFLIKAYKSGKIYLYAVAGLLAGITLYTYAVSYIVIPIALFLSLVYMIWTRKVKVTQVVAFVIPLAVLAFPLLLVQYINIKNLPAFQIGIFTIPRLPEYAGSEIGFKEALKNLVDVAKVAVISDGIEYNTSSTYFTFLPMSVAFAIVGIVVFCITSVKNIAGKRESGGVFVFLFFLAELFAGAIMQEPNSNRMNGIYFPVMFIIVCGIVTVLGLFKGNVKRIVAGILAAAYVVYFGFFLNYYFNDFNPELTSSMCPEAIEFINEDEVLSEKMVVTNIPPHNYGATKMASPDLINEIGDYIGEDYYYVEDKEALENCVYNLYGASVNYLLLCPDEEELQAFESLGYERKTFGSFSLFY